MTVQKPVVGVIEAVTLLFIFLSARIVLTHVTFIIHDGMNAAWMIPIINTMVGLLGILLLVSLLNKFPGRDLLEIGEKIAGPYVNTLFAFYYLALFIAGAGLTLRVVSEQLVSGFLPDTPISMVTLFIIAGTMIVSYLGIEAVARTARFLAGVLVVSSFGLLVLTIPLWQYHVFYPLLGPGPMSILKGALSNTGDFAQILLLGIIFPFLPARKAGVIGVWGVMLAGAFMFIFILVPILVFTFPVVTEITLPSFGIARLINIGRFGQRLEVVFLPIWIFGNMIFISVSLYAGAAVLARISALHDQRPFVLSTTVLTVVVAFIPQSAIQTAYWNHRLLSHYSFALLVAILLILLAIARFKGAGGGDQNEQGA